jgi:glycosyltransferase involved in cell wall biosynthesis
VDNLNLISVAIIAKNVSQTIVECLDSCKGFEEVILVIDDSSNDETAQIASLYNNVKIFHSPFLGFGKMKQYASNLASNSWVLSLDADEVLSQELLSEIKNLSLNDHCIYAIHRFNFFRKKHIDACGWNNDFPKRIFNKQKTTFSDNEIHESLMMKSLSLVKLNGPLLHFAYETEAQLREKAERYAQLYAKENYKKKESTSFKAYYKSTFTFIKDFFLRKGFLYGKDGYTLSKYNALGSYLKYKYLAIENDKLNHTLIVSTYNRPDALTKVLESVFMQNTIPFEVIIADDGSTNETAKVIDTFKSKIKNLHHVWHTDEGFRLATIRNKAILKSKGDFISLIDGDMVLHPDFIKTIKLLAKKNTYLQGKRVLLSEVTSNLFLKEKDLSIHFLSSGITNRFNTISSLLLTKFLSKKYNSIKSVKGCSMHFWKEDALKINGFNEAFVGWGREDSEFLCRLLNAGVERKNIILGAVAYHLFHKEASRSMLSENDEILNQCIQQKKKWCDTGITNQIN